MDPTADKRGISTKVGIDATYKGNVVNTANVLHIRP